MVELSDILTQIERDAKADRFSAWGRSTLIDEYTGVASIDKPLFDALHRAAGIEATFPIGNAGVIHVYGYWLSEVPTPFGYKRDRWLDGALATALGLEPHAFHLDADPSTTLLERVTSATLPHLAGLAGDSVTDIELSSTTSRIVTTQAPGSSTTALIYGLGSVESGFKVITVFPVADALAVLSEAIADPRLRFNAVD